MCRLIETPIIKTMRETAVQLGIISDLVAIRDCCGPETCDDCRRHVDQALEMLGVQKPTPTRLPLPPSGSGLTECCPPDRKGGGR